jgi:predicted enzyme related to lactoylglutathione lyase
MIKEIAFVAYPVSDMKRARHFYEQVLGLKLEYNYQEEWIEYAVGAGTFAITTMDVQHPPGRRGAIIAFEVDNLDATLQSLQKQNVKFFSEVAVTPVCRSFAAADPDGNEIVLHQRSA